jgi:hypothetical protein
MVALQQLSALGGSSDLNSLGGGGSGISMIGSTTAGRPATRPRNIVLVRAERFVEADGGSPRIDVTDAWLDIDTLGTRLIAKSQVPIARVGIGPGGVEIYGVRDEKNVEFVVRPPRPLLDKDVPQHIATMGSRMNAQTPTGSASTGDCGHMRVRVAVEPGSGQMVSVFGTAMLPPAPDDEETPDTKSAADDDNAHGKAKTPRDVRTRPFVASLSVSQTQSEKEPIVSVAFGWTGKDQHQRF